MILCPGAGRAFTFLPDQKSKQKSHVKTNGPDRSRGIEFIVSQVGIAFQLFAKKNDTFLQKVEI